MSQRQSEKILSSKAGRSCGWLIKPAGESNPDGRWGAHRPVNRAFGKVK